MLYLIGQERPDDSESALPWTFNHWPSHEVLTNLSDRKRHTCVKFTTVQLINNVLLMTTDPFRPIPFGWGMRMFSRNLALPSECASSILVMTRVLWVPQLNRTVNRFVERWCRETCPCRQVVACHQVASPCLVIESWPIFLAFIITHARESSSILLKRHAWIPQ